MHNLVHSNIAGIVHINLLPDLLLQAKCFSNVPVHRNKSTLHAPISFRHASHVGHTDRMNHAVASESDY